MAGSRASLVPLEILTSSGKRTSVKWTNKAPSKKPTRTGINDMNLFSLYVWSVISSAGSSNDQKVAAVMTPAANPKLASRNDRLKNVMQPNHFSTSFIFLLNLDFLADLLCIHWRKRRYQHRLQSAPRWRACRRAPWKQINEQINELEAWELRLQGCCCWNYLNDRVITNEHFIKSDKIYSFDCFQLKSPTRQTALALTSQSAGATEDWRVLGGRESRLAFNSEHIKTTTCLRRCLYVVHVVQRSPPSSALANQLRRSLIITSLSKSNEKSSF